MKTDLLKGSVLSFFLSLVFPLLIHSQTLIVSGVTNPTAVNGTYTIQSGTLYGYSYWKHSTQNYYIYNDVFSGQNYWNIDSDQDDADSYFYAQSTSTPPTGLTWSAYSGTGTALVEDISLPEISIYGNNTLIADNDVTPAYGDHTAFGSVNVSSGTSARTYTILNGGGVALTLTGSSPYVSISGANAGDFSVTVIPSGTVNALASTTFQITFNPSGTGIRNAAISIPNTDGDENPYNFNIYGNGFNPANMVVSGITSPSGANGNYIHQGILFNFEYWKHESSNYYLYNDEFSGARYWNIDDDTDDAMSFFFSQDHIEDPSPVNVITWSIPTGSTGTGSPTVYDANPAPNISLYGDTVLINDEDATPSLYDHTDFGSVNFASGSIIRTFTIENRGNAALLLSGVSPYVTISGTDAGDFNITAIPSSSIAAAGTTTFQVTFNPSAEGTRTATISVANNDADKNPYNFSIQGRGFAPKDLIVSGITIPSEAFGVYIHQGVINQFQYWKHTSAEYYIYNDDYNGSRYWNIDNNTDDAASYFYCNDHFESTSPVDVLSWHAEPGYSGTPLINYNGPEMNVTGNGISISDGDLTPASADHTDFGTAAIAGGTVVRTFAIVNSGGAALTTGTVSISGTNAGDFTVTTFPASTVATGGSTTFQVTFDPSSTGTRSAAISIVNNDNNENPYDFSIQGTGIAPEINVQGNITSIADGDATPSSTDHTDFGSQLISGGIVSRTFTILNNGNATLNLGSNAVSLSGGQSGDFSITTQPETTVAAGGGSTSFTVQFDPSAAGLRSTTINIVNDDADENPFNFSVQGTGIPTLEINDISINENDGTADFTVSLSHIYSNDVTVNYATANNTATTADIDYTNTSGTSTITAGNLTTTVSVPVSEDTHYETDETFYVNLSGASFGSISVAQGVGTIVNEDNPPSVTLGINGTPLAENGGLAIVTATLSNRSYENVTVDLGYTGTATGTDYTAPVSVTVNAGSLSNTANITGINDAADENDETVIIEITGVTNGTESVTQQLTATINDDDAAPSIAVNDPSVTEGDGETVNLIFTVSLTAISEKTITVDYATSSGTATAGTDYTSITGGMLTFLPGESDKNVTVTILGDMTDEENETLNLDLTNPSNGTISDSRGTGTITDNDPLPGISVNDVTLTEGNSGTTDATFTVSLSTASGKTITVNYSTADNTAMNGDDYTTASNTLTFNPGFTAQTVSVQVSGDVLDENDETYYINLSGAANATITDNQGVGTITDDDDPPTVTLSVSTESITEASENSTITATLSAASSKTITINIGVTGTATGSGTDYSISSTTISITPGNTTGESTISTVQDLITEGHETIILDITGVTNGIENGIQQEAILILDDDLPKVSLSQTVTSIDEASGINTVTATLSDPFSEEIMVTIGVNIVSTATGGDTDYILSSTTIAISPGDLTGSVSIEASQDLLDEDNETVIIDIISVTNGIENGTQQVSSTITDDDNPPVVNFTSASQSSADESGIMIITAQLSEVSGKTIDVPFSINAISNATGSGTDYSVISGPVTITAGNTSTMITVTITEDDLNEDNETVIVDMGAPANAVQGITVSHTVIITDDDDPEINVLGNGISITDGSTDPSESNHTGFGIVTVDGGMIVRTFTIQNTGNTSLSLTGPSPYIQISGTNSEVFSVSVIPSALVDAGGSTTFQVTFGPSVTGIYSATISIASDDGDEDPYDFEIQGVGIDVPVVTTEEASMITDNAASITGNIMSDGGAIISDRGIVYSITDNTPSIGETGVIQVTEGTGTGEFNELISSLTEGTVYFAQVYATNEAGTSYGGVISFTTLQTQVITFYSLTDVTYGDASFTLSAGSGSGLEITYTSSDLSVASISGNTVTITGAGVTMITASQAGNNIYAPAADVVQTLTVNPKTLTLTGTFSVYDKEYDGNVSATVNEDGLSITGLITGDTVGFDYVAEFTEPDPGIDIQVIITNIELTGPDKLNYTLSTENWPSSAATITSVSGIDEISQKKTVVYPNPFDEIIGFSNSDNIVKFTAVNINGKKVIEKNINGEKVVNTLQLPCGEYFILVEYTNGDEQVIKMIKTE